MNARKKRFCFEYIKDRNGTQSMRRAGFTGTDASLATMAGRLLKNVEVIALIDQAEKRREERTGIDADAVLRKLMAVAFADPRKLVEYRRRCCRFCWGTDHLHQRTKREAEEERQRIQDQQARHASDPENVKAPEPFQELGGDGFNHTKLPHERCPECRGEGRPEVFIHDTDTLDDEALALYAGCKHTKDGIEVMTASQEQARALLAKHFGITKERVEHNIKVTLEQLLSESWEKPQEPKT